MNVYSVVQIPGTKKSQVININDMIEENLINSIIFMVRAGNSLCAQEVAIAVKDIQDIWINDSLLENGDRFISTNAGNFIRPKSNLSRHIEVDFDLANGIDNFYVYTYSKPVDYKKWIINKNLDRLWELTPSEMEHFYVGSGTLDDDINLFQDLIKQLFNSEILIKSKSINPLLSNIIKHLSDSSKLISQDLIKKIAFFSGAFAEEKSKATEIFLRNNLGVYEFSTNSIGVSKFKSIDFISRPKSYIEFPAKWRDTVREFEIQK